MTLHNVKISPIYFQGVINGTKPFEFRKNDRNYQQGDCVFLQECIVSGESPYVKECYTGRGCYVLIKEVFKLGQIYPELLAFMSEDLERNCEVKKNEFLE